MGTFRICVANHDFTASEEVDLPDPTAARAQAMKGALQIGVDEVCKGKPFFGAEVSIESGNKIVGRFVIAIGASPLQ